jgi:hypothetical protein
MFKPRIATTLAGAALLTACGFNALPRDAAPREGAGLAARVKAIPEPASRSILSPHFNERDGAPISTIVLHHTAMVRSLAQPPVPAEVVQAFQAAIAAQAARTGQTETPG